MTTLALATLICLGSALTHPRTNVRIEIKSANDLSLIRYEIVEGSLAGTGYIQSVGYMHKSQDGMWVTYASGEGLNATKLTFMQHGNHIMDARFTHYSSNMTNAPVECSSVTGGGGHDH